VLSALSALTAAVARRLRKHGHEMPPDAYLLGRQRQVLLAALQTRALGSVAVIDWPTFLQLSSALDAKGLDGLRAAVALSSSQALTSGLTAEVVDTLECANPPRPQSVLFGRVTRATGGHVIFRSQLLVLADGEFGITPLELSSLLERHTPAAIRAMFLARLIRQRPGLESEARQTIVFRATRHLDRLQSEGDAARALVLLLRLAHARVRYPLLAREVLRRVRVVDFRARHAAAAERRARPAGKK
jgi:hypothetical protein